PGTISDSGVMPGRLPEFSAERRHHRPAQLDDRLHALAKRPADIVRVGEFHFVQRIHELVDTRDGAVEMKLFDIFGDLPDNAVRGFAQRLDGLRKLQWGRRADWRNR